MYLLDAMLSKTHQLSVYYLKYCVCYFSYNFLRISAPRFKKVRAPCAYRLGPKRTSHFSAPLALDNYGQNHALLDLHAFNPCKSIKQDEVRLKRVNMFF